MIFSSQLGKQDGLTAEQSIKNLANHLRKMQEELEYRLSGNLDSSNINEINADETNVLVKGEDIVNIITEQDSNMSAFEQTVNGFRQLVADYEQGYSEWLQTVEGFKSTVDDYKTKVSQWEQTVDGFKSQVADYEKGYSEWTHTVDGFTSAVNSYTEGYSKWEQTVKGFQAAVVDYQNALATTLRLDSSGLYITDQNGNTVLISGSQIDASTIKVNNLYGEYVYLKFLDYYDYTGKPVYSNAGLMRITGASSGAYGYALELLSRGALRLNAEDGSVYIQSTDYIGLNAPEGISCAGDVFPSTDNLHDLGSPYYNWADIYAENTEIITSDREKKNSIDYNMDRYEKFFDLLKPCSYKLNGGSSDRKHVGMISQDVEEAMTEAGLTSQDFAGFIKTPKKDKAGNEIEGEYEYALRYGEFSGMIIKELQKLKARVDELEGKENNDGQAG